MRRRDKSNKTSCHNFLPRRDNAEDRNHRRRRRRRPHPGRGPPGQGVAAEAYVAVNSYVLDACAPPSQPHHSAQREREGGWQPQPKEGRHPAVHAPQSSPPSSTAAAGNRRRRRRPGLAASADGGLPSHPTRRNRRRRRQRPPPVIVVAVVVGRTVADTYRGKALQPSLPGQGRHRRHERTPSS